MTKPTERIEEAERRTNSVEESSMIEAAWSIIANAGHGSWESQGSEWRSAAEAWRSRYHRWLKNSVDKWPHEPETVSPQQLRDWLSTPTPDSLLNSISGPDTILFIGPA